MFKTRLTGPLVLLPFFTFFTFFAYLCPLVRSHALKWRILINFTVLVGKQLRICSFCCGTLRWRCCKLNIEIFKFSISFLNLLYHNKMNIFGIAFLLIYLKLSGSKGFHRVRRSLTSVNQCRLSIKSPIILGNLPVFQDVWSKLMSDRGMCSDFGEKPKASWVRIALTVSSLHWLLLTLGIFSLKTL